MIKTCSPSNYKPLEMVFNGLSEPWTAKDEAGNKE